MQAKRKYEIIDISRENFGRSGATRRGDLHDTYEHAAETIAQIINKIPADLMGTGPVFTIREIWVAERSGK